MMTMTIIMAGFDRGLFHARPRGQCSVHMISFNLHRNLRGGMLLVLIPIFKKKEKMQFIE